MNKKLFWAVLLALSAGGAEANGDRIAGKWAADSRTKGGLGAMLVFADDGAVTSTFGALVDFKYEVEGQTIKMTFAGSPQPAAEPYAFIGDKLVAYPAEADPKKRQERTRVGAARPGAPRVVGLWAFKHYTGAMATIQYTSRGSGQLSVPMKTMKGRYRLKDQKLTMKFKGQPASSRRIGLSGDQLTLLADGDRPEQRFTRVSP